MAAQKTLIQQLQESEAEARELQDFLQVYFVTRELKNISRDPTFWDFVIFLAEGSMQDVTVARLQSIGAQTPFSPLFEM
jgi:hypothetical protein